MVQLEVARRMAAERGSKDYAAYAVLAQLLARVSISHRVPPTVFDPPPRVHSAVVEMERREPPDDYQWDKAPRARRVQKPPQTARQQPAGAGPRTRSTGPRVPWVRAEREGRGTGAGRLRGLVRRRFPGRCDAGGRLRAFAKVNYALDVLGLRADGYHEVSTVMQSISLADEVELRRAAGGFDLSLEPEEVRIGPQERNTTYLAWKALRRLTGEELPVEVSLRKRIPAGAGLGGGSADAAAVLVGLNELFGLGLRVDELRGIGAGIGADVPSASREGRPWAKASVRSSRRCLRRRPIISSSPNRSVARTRARSTAPTTRQEQRAHTPSSRSSRRCVRGVSRPSPRP